MKVADIIPGVNTISRKVSVASINKAGRSVVFWDPSGGFRGWNTLTKFLDSKEHLDWFKIDLNAAEVITVQGYRHKKKLMWMEVHIYSVKA